MTDSMYCAFILLFIIHFIAFCIYAFVFAKKINRFVNLKERCAIEG